MAWRGLILVSTHSKCELSASMVINERCKPNVAVLTVPNFAVVVFFVKRSEDLK